MTLRKISLNSQGHKRTAWITDCGIYVIKPSKGQYNVLHRNSHGGYTQKSTFSSFETAKQAIYKLQNPTPAPKFKVIQGGQTETPGVIQIRKNLREYKKRETSQAQVDRARRNGRYQGW